LRLEGHKAFSTLSGTDALRFLDSQTPDLVILDFMMPGLDGIETLQQIRLRATPSALPVIMYTAVSDPDFRLRAIAAGANDYFAKGTMDYRHLSKMIEDYALCSAPVGGPSESPSVAA
jgi:DNA-binding response OmpR family regulator